MEKYTILNEVGRGAFGIVWKAQNKETKEIVAIKQMLQEFETWDECINLRELKSLRKLSHPNIIKLKEVFRVKKQLSFVFEFADKNIYKLYERAKEDGATQLAESSIKVIVYQIASALAYMHKHGFFHRDLKPENLMISSENVVKLIDLGLAREIRSRPPFTDYVSTRWYRAPEILLRSTSYNSPVDVFALGCIMAELYLMKPLFNGSSELDQIQKVTSVLGTPSKSDWPDGYILASQKHFTFASYPAIPLSQVIPNCPPDGLSLIQEMLRWDPQKRITPAKILSHPYFNGIELPEEIKNAGGDNPVSQQESSKVTTSNNTNTSSSSGYSMHHSHSLASNNFNSQNYQNSHSNHLSSSPDKRFQQNHRSQSDMGAFKAFESNSNKPSFTNGIGMSSQAGNGSSFAAKKPLDPIFEFLNNDMSSLASSNTQNNNTNQSRFTSMAPSQQPSSSYSTNLKSKIPDSMDELEQEILGTYLPTSSTISRTRQPLTNNNSSSSSMFGQDNSTSSYSSSLNQQQSISRLARDNNNNMNNVGAISGNGGGYISSVATRQNDIYNFDGIKQVGTQNNSSTQSNQLRSANFDIYNFDNILPQGIRKQQ